nr:MAG TPA: cysteine sulfinate desulfinase/cysteine desulfurase [Caudoviricetes sp.]
MYLDNAATTPLTQQVKDYIISLLDTYQNPSSIYQSGIIAKQVITTARNNVAKFINADSKDIIFTSSGSASNTLAIKGYIQKHNCTVLYSPIAHKSILKCVESIKNAYPLKVDQLGRIDADDLKDWLDTKDKYFVILSYADSEIGTIQDIKRIIDLIHFYNGVVYVDCTGSISQIPLNVKDINFDMAGFSGHKIHALKGIGVLYKKENIELEPLIYGSQEMGLSSGTENILGIASVGKAVENYNYHSITSKNRDYVYNYILQNIPDSYLVGTPVGKQRLPHNLYICFKGIQGESLLILMDMDNIQINTGSACSSGSQLPSSTLLAIGMDKEDINSCVRLSFSGTETQEELDYVCEKLRKNVDTLRRMA